MRIKPQSSGKTGSTLRREHVSQGTGVTRKNHSPQLNQPVDQWSVCVSRRRLRTRVIGSLCHVDDPDCLSEAARVYKRWTQDPTGSGK